MKTIRRETFEKFTGTSLRQFLDSEEKVKEVEAIRVEVTPLSNLFALRCKIESHGGSLGSSELCRLYWAITEDGEVLTPPREDSHSGDNTSHVQDVNSEGINLGEGWENISHIKYVVEYVSDYESWEGGSLTDDCFIVLHLVRDDDKDRIKKIRRRTEDALRKAGATEVLRIAALLDVNMAA